jgi:hypothetical protein
LDVVVVDVVGDCGRWFFIVRSRSVGDIWVGGVVALYVRPGHCDVGVPARLWRSSADSSPGYGRELIWGYVLVFLYVYIYDLVWSMSKGFGTVGLAQNCCNWIGLQSMHSHMEIYGLSIADTAGY